MKKTNDFEKHRGALKHLAFNSNETLGRRHEEDDEITHYGNLLDPFQLDVEKIRLGKFYRRLYGKTQVFPPDKHTNIRNRQIHTQEVVSLATFLASVLGLNKHLAEAIAYGHDIGHTPFGHLGERIITNICGEKFQHAVMSVVIAQQIERAGKGLNLCYETLEGMLNHSRGGEDLRVSNDISSEASLVMMSDKIAYTFSDLNDATKVGYLPVEKFPKKLISYFGATQRERIAKTCLGLIKESSEKGELSFSTSEEAKYFVELRTWMYENVYYPLDCEEDRISKGYCLNEIWKHYDMCFKKTNPTLAIAILTDNEALRYFKSCYTEEKTGYFEIINKLEEKKLNIDIFNHDLNPEDFKYHN